MLRDQVCNPHARSRPHKAPTERPLHRCKTSPDVTSPGSRNTKVEQLGCERMGLILEIEDRLLVANLCRASWYSAPVSIALLHVDEHLVVADKPSGLLVHRGWADDDDVALFRVRDAIGVHVYPVHRLDRGTSGVLLFARNEVVAAALSRAFEAGEVEKRYLALVRGNPPDAGVIDHPVPKKEQGDRVPAVTEFSRLALSTVERCALVEARPLTGRLHQIRRHLKHIDHPLIGDVNYGRGELNRHYRARYGLHRIGLHARSLSFVHPVEQTRLCVTAPIPADFAPALHALGLLGAVA
jgi:tRNA pseudouridine65 synthase